jgi:phosphoketolase
MSVPKSLSTKLLHKLDAYWRAANYLSIGQIYLYDNPLLKKPLALRHIKPHLLGHWGTTPGLNFIYVHLTRVIKQHDLIMPDFRNYTVDVPSPGAVQAADTHELGEFLREVVSLNSKQRNFSIFGHDETLSNRLNAVFGVTDRQWEAAQWNMMSSWQPTAG